MSACLTRRALCFGLAAVPVAVAGQQVPPEGVPESPVLTVDTQRMFSDSAFGQRVAREIEERSLALAQENQRITAELAAEERDLTDQRTTLPAEDFRVLADAYDKRVQETRRAQIAKSDALDAYAGQQQRVFLTAAAPVLEALMRDAGAVVVLERERTLISINAVDVTEIAIARIDAMIGAGE